MLPFPNRIVGSKQLFIPIAYVGVTCSLCYYFLMAFVDTQRYVLGANSNSSNNFVQFKPFQATVSPPEYLELSAGINSADQSNQGDANAKNVQLYPYDTSQIENDFGLYDNLSPAYYPWINDDKCKGFMVRFVKKKTFKPRALVSYPGSGNSWTRYLLEGSSGIFTGSVFGDKKLYAMGLLGELRSPNDGSTIVQKTHHDTLSSVSKSLLVQRAQAKLTELLFGYRGILLIRNPYDALRSYWNFMNTRDHKAHVLPTQFSPAKWKEFVEDGAKRWASLIEIWLEKSVDFIIVQYEELQLSPRQEITRMLEYLSLPVDEKRMDCVLSHLEGPFHRQPSSDQEKVKLSYTSNNSHLYLVVQENIEHVNRLLALNNIELRLNYTHNEGA